MGAQEKNRKDRRKSKGGKEIKGTDVKKEMAARMEGNTKWKIKDMKIKMN